MDRPTNDSETKRGRRILSSAGKVLAAVLWIGIIVLLFLHRRELGVDTVLSHTPDNLAAAALVMLLLFALKSVTLVMYSGILFAASGLLFPLPFAWAVNAAGCAVMVTIPYLIGARRGTKYVNRIAESHPKAAALGELRSQNDFLFTFLVRLLGVLPSDVLSLWMGASGIHYPSYLAGCLLGFLPPMLAFPVMGRNYDDPASPEFLAAAAAAVLFALTAAVGSAAVHRRKRNGQK